jgi:cytosine/adenosine deaminase-related metal-dependent hydrolase
VIGYRAAWVVPVAAPPIRDGLVAVDGGRIVAVGVRHTGDGVTEIDLGETAILPGLVNAHTHLELSYLHGQVPPSRAFVGWVRSLLAARRHPDPGDPRILGAVAQAVEQAEAFGTAVVGDITNTLVTVAPLLASSLAAVVFHELIGFNAPEPDALVAAAAREVDAHGAHERVRVSLAAHAPYSVAPRLFRAIHAAVAARRPAPWSVHLSESAQEVAFIRDGSGAWRELLEELGAWDPAWSAPGVSPVHYLDDCGFLDDRVLAVHGVQMTPADLRRLRQRGATLVTCPRSNAHTGAGAPPIAAFYESGVRVAIGTDSLASAPDLNVFAELAAIHALAPAVPPAVLIDSATRQGARALGFDADFGTIEPGKRARLLAVSVPPGTGDVEEYVVSGVGREEIRWIV